MTIPECSCGLCRRLLAATVTVQHCTLPEEGYDAASYLVGYGGSGHGICIALHCDLSLSWKCIFEVVLNFVLKFIRMIFLNISDLSFLSYLCLNCCLMNL